MRWSDLLFVHWRVDPELMRGLLPPGLEVDTFDGSAWVGLVPFLMDDVRFFGLPGLPTLRRFHECNVRTYVLRDGIPGVWFFSLDAASRLAVFGGRNLWGLNYVNARFRVGHEEGGTDHRLVRRDGRRTRVHWSPGEVLPPSESGSLRHFLTERYHLYARRRGRLLRGTIWHEPWTLRRAEIHELDDELVAAAGVETEGDPSFLAADPVSVLGWRNQRVGGPS